MAAQPSEAVGVSTWKEKRARTLGEIISNEESYIKNVNILINV